VSDAPVEDLAPGSILARAAERGRAMSLGYAGAVTPREAHELREAGEAAIVDVRTAPEWKTIGHVLEAPLIEWPRGAEPPRVEQFVAALEKSFPHSQRLLFICRSGVRSHYAAEVAARAGFRESYNVLEGFEGEHGAGRNGWRATGLPWERE
jgi:rhodanese-related sulfurtransferase